MEVEVVVGVVNASAVEVVGGAQVLEGRPCFLDLPLPRLEPGPHPAISNMYNMYKIENVIHMLIK